MQTSVTYLLHANQPIPRGTRAKDGAPLVAGHYLGSTRNLDARLAEHASGQGARLTQVVEDAGITWTLARTWRGGRSRERQLKKQGGASRYCPVCKAT